MTSKQIEKVKNIIAKARDDMAKLEYKKKVILSRIAAAQVICEHPETWSDGGGYGGQDWSSTYCSICEKLIH